MLTFVQFDDSVKEIKSDPRFQKISKSSRKYFEDRVDDLLDTLGNTDEVALDNSDLPLPIVIEKIFDVKIKDHFSKKNEAKALKLINGFKALLTHIR